MTELEMKAQLDGNFYSFAHCPHKGTYIHAKAVTENYSPTYASDNQPLEAARRGASKRVQMMAERSAALWTPERVEELSRLRTQHNYGEKRISLIMGLGRCEVANQLRRMGLKVTKP